jgi:hypothetical protein
MNLPRKSSFALLLVLAAALMGGCSMQGTRDSSVPWSQPASWENQVPGMGTGNGGLH